MGFSCAFDWGRGEMSEENSQGVSDDDKAIARKLAAAFNRPIKVFSHRDDEQDDLEVNVFYAPDAPARGVASYGTIGLSNSPLFTQKGEAQHRLELVGACASEVEHFPNALATVAMKIMGGHPAFPGAIFHGVIDTYKLSPTMSSMMLVDPFLWDDPFAAETLSAKTVAWLQAIPISKEEAQFAQANGADALTDLFVEEQIDVYDIERSSVVGRGA